jgi:hypothetical protein
MAEEGAVAGEEDIPLHADLGQGMETLADTSAQQVNAANRVGLMMGMNPDQTHYRGVAASAAGDARMSATGDVNTVTVEVKVFLHHIGHWETAD